MKLKKPTKEVLDKASGYQWIIKGEYYTLDQMDRGQLMQALMDTLDAMESVEDKMSDINEVVDRWRNGKPNNWDV